MGEGIGKLGQNVQAQAAAAQASEDIKKKKEAKTKKTIDKGLDLAGIPKEAEAKITVEEKIDEAEEVDTSTEAAESVLTEMDTQLENIQKGLKEFIGKKIKLAAQNPPRSKELLHSAYQDTKKAYDKIKKVREQLS